MNIDTLFKRAADLTQRGVHRCAIYIYIYNEITRDPPMNEAQPIISAAAQLLDSWQGEAAAVLLRHFLNTPGIDQNDEVDVRALLNYIEGGDFAAAHKQHADTLQVKADVALLLAQQRAAKRQRSAERKARKAYLRVEVAALLRAGATHKEMRQRLNATGWEISHAVNWNKAHGVDMQRDPETYKPFIR